MGHVGVKSLGCACGMHALFGFSSPPPPCQDRKYQKGKKRDVTVWASIGGVAAAPLGGVGG